MHANLDSRRKNEVEMSNLSAINLNLNASALYAKSIKKQTKIYC